jgi:hypothetical protein
MLCRQSKLCRRSTHICHTSQTDINWTDLDPIFRDNLEGLDESYQGKTSLPDIYERTRLIEGTRIVKKQITFSIIFEP